MSVRIEATTAGSRHVVYLYVDGFRFEMEAPTAPRAREIAMELAAALGFEVSHG